MPLVQSLDNYDLTEFAEIAAAFGQDRFGYVVTPNVDHLIRYHDDSSFRSAYADATYILLDSRFLSFLFRLSLGIRVRVCTGSDLTAKLFNSVMRPDDRIVLVGGSDLQASYLANQFGLRNLRHFNPPMGFIHKPEAVEECLHFIESQSPFRFCILAVGAPQQELVAQQLKVRGKTRGLVLCTGASINFLTGAERRAPRWIQVSGFEWAFRLGQNPRRLAHRYLVRGPRIFALLRKTKIVLRRALAA
jgi:N-acetylglucosaminyldiphosphoundecaprenol N-acetyl-beta-D-mannosaminyltransferase